MGKEVGKAAIRQGHEILLKIDVGNSAALTPEKLSRADVAIEFTTPGTAPGNILACFEAGVPVIVGTTGWYDRFSELAGKDGEMEGTLFQATTSRIGVDFFFHVKVRTHVV